MNVFSVVNSPHESNFKTITSHRLAIRDVHHMFKSNQAKYYSFNERYADCTFIVGSNQTKVLGIRVLFAIQSEYFNALLFNTFFNSQQINCDNYDNKHNINEKFNKPTFYEPDVSIETFEFIMKYCYGIHDDLYITLDNVFEIYYASQKYLIDPLSSKCGQFIYRAINTAHAANPTSIEAIIKLYSFAIKRGCPALADKIEIKLVNTLREMDNTNVMVTFMNFFNELVSNNKLDDNLKLIISNCNQHIFELLLYTLLRKEDQDIDLNKENCKTILVSCKNYIFYLPYQLFLKWFVENKLFNASKQEICDVCVEYCKHFIARVQKAKTKTKSASNTCNNGNDNSTLDIDIANYSKLSLDGDDVKSMEILMDVNNNNNNTNVYNSGCDCDDIDVCDHSRCTFDFDLNFKSCDDMYQQLFEPSIHVIYSNAIATKSEFEEKEISRIDKEKSRKQISEIANKIRNGDAQTRLKSLTQLEELLNEDKLEHNMVMETPNLVKTMIELLNPQYNHNMIINDFVNKEIEVEKYVNELNLQILWCITHLVCSESNICQEMVKMGIIQTIMIVLHKTTNDHDKVKKQCVWLLSYIAEENAEYKHFMLHHKLLKHLIHNWIYFNIYAREKVFELISILCCWNKNEQISQIESEYWQDIKLCIKLVSDIIDKKISSLYSDGFCWITMGMLMNCLNIIDSFVYDSPSSLVHDVIECVCNGSKLIDNIALLLKNQVMKYNHSITELAKKYRINIDECKKQLQVSDFEFEENHYNHYNYNYGNNINSASTIVTNKHIITLIKLKAWNSIKNISNGFATMLFRILGGIVAYSDKQTQMVLDSGFLEFLIPFIQSLCVDRRVEAFWFLSNILAGTSQQIKQVVRNPVLVKAIINTCLYERSNDASFPALRCIYNLMDNRNKDDILIFKNEGCILCLIKFLHSTNEKEILLALSGLESMLLVWDEISDNDHHDNTQVKEILDELDQLKGLDRLKQLQTIESVSDKIHKESHDLVKMINSILANQN